MFQLLIWRLFTYLAYVRAIGVDLVSNRRDSTRMTASYRLALGIRREIKNQWERRVPLTPGHIEKLVKDYNATVYVQPSTKRIYPDAAYSAVRRFLSLNRGHLDMSEIWGLF